MLIKAKNSIEAIEKYKKAQSFAHTVQCEASIVICDKFVEFNRDDCFVNSCWYKLGFTNVR